MGVTNKERFMYESRRDHDKTKKFKNVDKLDDRILAAFDKLNNKKCYDFLDDEKSRTFQNLLDFLTLLEKKCERRYGHRYKYSKSEVEDILIQLFHGPTDTQAKTIRKINKKFKKNKYNLEELYGFKFEALLTGKNIPTWDENRYADYIANPGETV